MLRVLLSSALALMAGAAVAVATEAPLLAPIQAPLVPQFIEEGKEAGITSVYAGEWQYMVGGGASSFDCNGDGYPDLLLAGGEGKASFYRNTSTRGGPLRFAAEASGLELEAVTGGYPIDIDSDGNMDIVLLRVGENIVMKGDGTCHFSKANAAWGFDGGDAWSTAFSATFEKDAAWPTLAIGNYIDRKQEMEPWGSCTANWLHRPKPGGGGFAPPIELTPSFCPLSMLFTDWNLSGTPSLRVSNDREYYEGGQEQMWHVDPGQAPRLFNPEEGWQYLRIWGMGIGSADVNGDGYPDYALTSMADHKVQTLAALPKDGKPAEARFKDIAYAMGATAHRPFMGADLKPSTGWHAQFEDVNNDGLPDLFFAKGNVDRMPDFAQQDPNNLLLLGKDKKFHEAADKAGVASTATSRGAMLTDFNLDGLVDLVVVNRRAPAQLWRNTTQDAGHWLQLRLSQAGVNRDAIGAWIEVKTPAGVQRREITSGGGHVSGQNGWWHFGLAEASSAEVRVLWPHGAAGPWQTLAADGFYRLSPGQDATPWQPER